MIGKRRLFLTVFLSLLIVTLMTFSLTYARYSEEKEADGVLSGELENIVSNEVEIGSVNEFFSAIENGYTNIKISDEVDNPLVITGSVSDVNSDLTIDLNGHELQRNNRDPMLNITAGVRLTIIDSKGGGSFYNPVGSVLRIDGGTLTVADGVFESGPRDGYGAGDPERYDSEYAQFVQSGSWFWTTYHIETPAGATIEETGAVNYYQKAGDRYQAVSDAEEMPVILPHVTITQQVIGGQTRERLRVNGNIYFKEAPGANYPGYNVIGEDCYLYYTIAGENVENTDMAATDKSADFYYTYYVTENRSGDSVSYEYAGTENASGRLLVTIYGYNNVLESANPDTASETPNYAAIQMIGGNLYVRGGRYTSYFGQQNTYCVQAAGGYMSVAQGSFEAMEEGICVGIDYPQDVSAAEYLNVNSGAFYSEIGDTIRVSGGRMNVSGGSFEKNVEEADGTSLSDDLYCKNGASINISNGELNVASLSPSELITFSLTGDKAFGIYSRGGAVSCVNTQFTINGAYAAGILSMGGGAVNIGGVFSCTVTCTGGTGDTASPLSATAISTEGGAITFADDCTATIQTDGLGITSRIPTGGTSADASTISLGGTTTLTSTHGTAIYMSGGSLIVNGTLNVTSTILGNPWVTPPSAAEGTIANDQIYNGIYVEGGSLNASAGTLNVTHTGIENEHGGNWDFNVHTSYQIRSFAVRVTGGSEGESVTIARGTIENSTGGGVYVSGGTVTLGVQNERTGPTIRTTGTNNFGSQNKPNAYDSNWSYSLTRTGGHAVDVQGGTLNIYGGNYSAQRGNGILVRNGTANVYSGSFFGNDAGIIAGPGASYAFKMYGGTANIYGGTFGQGSQGSGAFIMGTSAQNPGIANIYGGNFIVNGQAGFSIYQYADVTFGTQGGDNAITVSGNATAIAIEKHHATTSQITIYGGAFRSTGSSGGYDGIWYGNTSVELTIYGGTFTGSARNGLYFDGDPGANVQIDGGTFIGAGNQRAFGGTSLSFNSILTAGRYAYGADSIATEGTTRIERTVWTGGSGANYRRIDVK